jgi:hypothetical protein
MELDIVGIAEEAAGEAIDIASGETVERLLTIYTVCSSWDYQVLGLLPERRPASLSDQEPAQSHERVMMESLLRRSGGSAPAAFTS